MNKIESLNPNLNALSQSKQAPFLSPKLLLAFPRKTYASGNCGPSFIAIFASDLAPSKSFLLMKLGITLYDQVANA